MGQSVDESCIRKVQLVQLDILKELIKIFSKYNLTYYVIGGTFLGAVRHNGFIPWDDDIDIAMPREDYTKLFEIAKKELPDYLGINYYKVCDTYDCCFRIMDKRVSIKENKEEKPDGFVMIDILSIDGYPDNPFKAFIHKIHFSYLTLLQAISNSNSYAIKPRASWKNRIFKIANALKLYKLINKKRLFNSIEKTLAKIPIKDCSRIGTITGAYTFHEIVPKELFGTPKLYKFEDIDVCGPELYDKYLTHIYGDYMKIPPESERKYHFAGEIIDNRGINK